MKYGHFNRDGKPKIGHASKEDAREHVTHLQSTTRKTVSAYPCAKCKLWHVGRSPYMDAKTVRRLNARDEMLVGRLIGLLRTVIDGGMSRA